MRSWQAVVVAFIMVMTFLAILFGYLGNPGVGVSFLSVQGSSSENLTVEGKTAGYESCPWQLDVVTLKDQGRTAGSRMSCISSRTNKS